MLNEHVSSKRPGWEKAAKTVLSDLTKEIPIIGDVVSKVVDGVFEPAVDWIKGLFGF